MIRWLIVIFVVLLVFNRFHPWLQKLGLGRLPGDIRFRCFGREIFIPLASSVALGGVVLLLGSLW